jgi:uncharacterized protein (DUF2141 family)
MMPRPTEWRIQGDGKIGFPTLMHIALVVAAVVALASPSEASILGPDAAACDTQSSEVAALVTVTGFKDRSGKIRVQLYPDNDKDFLRSGKKLTAEGKVFRRVEAPTPAEGDAAICVKLPGAGRYAMAVLHDRNADGKLNVFSDGFGFPNNPKVRLGTPDVDKVAFQAGTGVTALAVRIDYLGGRPKAPKPEK